MSQQQKEQLYKEIAYAKLCAKGALHYDDYAQFEYYANIAKELQQQLNA